jgi:hypothetical protein
MSGNNWPSPPRFPWNGLDLEGSLQGVRPPCPNRTTSGQLSSPPIRIVSEDGICTGSLRPVETRTSTRRRYSTGPSVSDNPTCWSVPPRNRRPLALRNLPHREGQKVVICGFTATRFRRA